MMRVRDERPQHVLRQGRVGLDQFLHRRFQRRRQVALGLLVGFHHGGEGQFRAGLAFGQGGANLSHVVVMLDQFGNHEAHVADGELADQAGEQEHEFAVGFLAVFDDPFHQGTQRLVFLLQNIAVGFQLPDPGREFRPCFLHFLNWSQRAGPVFGRCHGCNIINLRASFQQFLADSKLLCRKDRANAVDAVLPPHPAFGHLLLAGGRMPG